MLFCAKKTYIYICAASVRFHQPPSKPPPVPGLVGPVAWHLPVTWTSTKMFWQNLGGPLAKGLTFSRLRLHYLKPPNSNSKGSFGPKGNIKDLLMKKKNAPFLFQSYSENDDSTRLEYHDHFFLRNRCSFAVRWFWGGLQSFWVFVAGVQQIKPPKSQAKPSLIDSKIQAITNLH